MSASESDPTHFDVAVQIAKWRKAMDEEMEAINKNGTWKLKELPDGAKKIGVKWIYKTKFKENGEVETWLLILGRTNRERRSTREAMAWRIKTQVFFYTLI